MAGGALGIYAASNDQRLGVFHIIKSAPLKDSFYKCAIAF